MEPHPGKKKVKEKRGKSQGGKKEKKNITKI